MSWHRSRQYIVPEDAMDSGMALQILPLKNNKLRALKVEYLTTPPLSEENVPNESELLQESVHW